MIKNYLVDLEILTPVIVNNGEVYDFCELIPADKEVKSKESDGEFEVPLTYRFYTSSNNIFAEMSPQEQKSFVQQSVVALQKRDNDSLKKLRNIVIEKSNKKEWIPGRMLEKAHADLMKKPFQEVSKVFQNPKSKATYIPGSSIKGAMRTAILEYIRENKKLDHWKDMYSERNWYNQRRMGKNFEYEIMLDEPSINVINDPFKYLKISDFTFEGKDQVTYIAKVGEDKMPIYSAMTNAYSLSSSPVVAKGTISIDDKFFSSLQLSPNVNDLAKLLDIVQDFFVEKSWNVIVGKGEINGQTMRKVHKMIAENYMNDRGALLRLGHYTGILNYTFKVNQTDPPKKNPRKDINKVGGRVVKIEGGIIPGICLMRIEDQE